MHTKYFVAGAIMVGKQYGLTLVDVEAILQGIFNILVHTQHIDEITTCFKDVDGVVNAMTIAIEDFKIQDASHIVDGIGQLGKIMVGIEKDT